MLLKRAARDIMLGVIYIASNCCVIASISLFYRRNRLFADTARFWNSALCPSKPTFPIHRQLTIIARINATLQQSVHRSNLSV